MAIAVTAHTAELQEWWKRPRDKDTGHWITNYQQSLEVRHRTIIAEIVRRIQPASILEIGCHCGPNLIRLAGEHPALDCLGIDINVGAVDAGNRWAQSKGLGTRVHLRAGAFPAATDRMDDQCADLVLSSYALAYMAPEDLDAALYECGRLAKRAVVIAEPQVIQGSRPPTPPHVSMNGYREWVHDYHAALPWIGTMREMTTSVETVSPPVDRLNAILVCERV